jgi:hypothetical protein
MCHSAFGDGSTGFESENSRFAAAGIWKTTPDRPIFAIELSDDAGRIW